MKQGIKRVIEDDQVDRSDANSSMGLQPAEPLSERRFPALSVIAVLLVLIAHVFWLSQNRSPMLWDDSLYAIGSLDLYDGLDANGLPGLLERFSHGLYGDRAPLICLLAVPFFLLFGRGSEWAFHAVGLLTFALVCFAAYGLARRLSNKFGGFIAVVLLCCNPLVAGLTRQFMVELPLLAAVLFWHYILVRSEFLERSGEETKLGVILGSGMLLKVTFPLFIAGSFLAGIGFHLLRRPAGRQVLWNWKGAAVLAGTAIVIVAATAGLPGHNAYFVIASLIAIGLFTRRFWSRCFPAGVERSLVMLGVAYLIAGIWYSVNLISLVRHAWGASFGNAALPYDQPLADYVAQILSFGVSNVQLALLLAGLAAVFLTAKRFNESGGSNGEPRFMNGARWMLVLWLLLPLAVFLSSHNRTVRFTLPCLAALPVAGGLLGAELRRRSRTVSTVWAGACAALGGALFVSFSFGLGPAEPVAIGKLVFWGRQLDWDQRPPDTTVWPHSDAVRAAARVLGDSTNRTVFILNNQAQLNWLNLKLAALRERLALDFEFQQDKSVQAAMARAANVQLFLVKDGGQTEEWTEQTAQALAATLNTGGLGSVRDVYALRLPDGGNLHFYRRVENDPEPALDPASSSHVLFGERIALVGLDLRREQNSLRIRADWRVERYLEDDYSVYLHFENAKGGLFARDHQLLIGGKGTRGLMAGEKFRQEFVIPLDAETRNSRVLRAGIYETRSLKKVPVGASTIKVLEGRDGILLTVPQL